MKRNWLYSLLCMAVVSGLLLAACGPAEPTVPDEPIEEPVAPPVEEPVEEPIEEPIEKPVEEPAERKVATFIWLQEFDTLNPFYTGMWFSSITQQL